MFAIRGASAPSATRVLKPCALALLALAAAASIAAGAGGVDQAQLIPNKFLLVLDPGLPASQVVMNLSQAGFTSVERVQGLPPRFNNYRLVQVPSADAATKVSLLAVPGVLKVRPVYQGSLDSVPYPVLMTGQVIARFTPDAAANAAAIGATAGCTISSEILGLPRAYVFDVDETQFDPLQAAGKLSAAPGVLYAQPDTLFRLRRFAADAIQDPLYVFQWHLHNTGQLEGGVPGEDIGAEDAWTITKGEGALVGVIDDCLQRDHEDLKDNYFMGYDFVDQDGDPSPHFGPDWYLWDTLGDFHGTCVAGIIAARDNDIGVRGVAPRARLIGCKIGLGYYYTTDQDVANAFLFVERSGAMAVNNSWGGPGQAILPVVPNSTLDYFAKSVIADSIHEVATKGRSGLGVLVLYAAGNDSMLLSYGNAWAGMEHVMAVNATMRDGRLACYSNFGPESSVSAPGGGVNFLLNCYDSDIATTDVTEVPGFSMWDLDGDGLPDPNYPIRGLNPPMRFLDVAVPGGPGGLCPNPNDYYCMPLVPDPTVVDFQNLNYTHHMNGTSSATPVATGVAALVFSINPGLTAREARNLIEHTARKVQLPNEHFDAVTGRNDHFGHGRVDAFAAVSAARAAKNWPSPVKNVQQVHSQSLIRIFWDNPDWDGDGIIDPDVSGVLVVRAPIGTLNWAPVDGIQYEVGQLVASNVMVVANDLIDSVDQTGLPQGDYEYAIFVRNAANNYSWGARAGFSSTGAITVPLASIVTNVTAGAAPLAVHFTGAGVDQGKILSYAWDFGDGASGAGPAVDHTYTATGRFTVTLTVTNAVGQTAQTTVVINVVSSHNNPPVVTLNANPATGLAPLVVLFQGSGTDPDGKIIRYDWNFGDGASSTGAVVEHTYLDPGTYGVTLTATDNLGGQGMASTLINVTTGTTAASDVVTSPAAKPAFCGNGVATATIASAIGLCGLMARRRRR